MSLTDELMNNPPKLHFWGGQWNTGGVSPPILTAIREVCASMSSGFSVIETGAGLSTLFFAACGAGAQICVAPDQELKDRLLAAFTERDLDNANLNYVVARSEDALPELTVELSVDIALIDGAHGFPSPFVDFCYCGRALKKDGVMIIDDVQLYSCALLFLLLKAQPGWQLIKLVGKTAFFRKLTDARYLPDFGGQPFLLQNSVIERL